MRRILRFPLSALVVTLILWYSTAAASSAGQGASRVEVILGPEHRANLSDIKQEFGEVGFTNVHVQFIRLGHPPMNLGLGPEVPADTAREAIRLALKYNQGIAILLPERLFPPRFITIASSNFDDTVEFPIDRESLGGVSSPLSAAYDSPRRFIRQVLIGMTGRPGLAICLGLLFSGGCLWDGSSAEAFEFSADRVFRRGDRIVEARVNARNDRWRFEYPVPQAGANATIVRGDANLAWHLLSQQRVYRQRPISPEERLLVEDRIEHEVARTLIGSEEREGFSCHLFEVTTREGNKTARYYRWITKREGFALKTVSEEDGWSVEYRNVRFVPQSDRLFEPPYAFSKESSSPADRNPPFTR